MITLKQGMRLSAIVDKLDIKLPDVNKGEDVFGAELMFQLLAKAHKAEKEIYALVADLRGCTAKEAEDVDLVELIGELAQDAGVRDFLSSAVTSQAQG